MCEALAIDWLKAGSRLLRLTWDEVSGIMGRAVKRGLARQERSVRRRMGVDETSFAKRHEYVTVNSDQETGAVMSVADGRGRRALDAYYVGRSATELTLIDSVSMDMSAAYIAASVTHVPDADRKICFDKFHVASHLGSPVDNVRRREHRELTASGDSTLAGTRYLWLKTPANMTRKVKAQLEDLRAEALLTAKARYYKEWAMGLWHYGSRTFAKKAWAEWYRSAVRTNLEPIKNVTREELRNSHPLTLLALPPLVRRCCLRHQSRRKRSTRIHRVAGLHLLGPASTGFGQGGRDSAYRAPGGTVRSDRRAPHRPIESSDRCSGRFSKYMLTANGFCLQHALASATRLFIGGPSGNGNNRSLRSRSRLHELVRWRSRHQDFGSVFLVTSRLPSPVPVVAQASSRLSYL